MSVTLVLTDGVRYRVDAPGYGGFMEMARQAVATGDPIITFGTEVGDLRTVSVAVTTFVDKIVAIESEGRAS